MIWGPLVRSRFHNLALKWLKTLEVTAGRLVRSYRNVAKSASSRKDCTGICHRCLAGRPGWDFENVLLSDASSMAV